MSRCVATNVSSTSSRHGRPLATGGKTRVLQTAGTEMGNRFRRSSGTFAENFFRFLIFCACNFRSALLAEPNDSPLAVAHSEVSRKSAWAVVSEKLTVSGTLLENNSSKEGRPSGRYSR